MAWLLLGRRSAPLWLRLGLPISLIIALAIGFISFLNYYNYRKTYQQLNVARIMVVVRDLRQAIESGLNVGLAPRANTPLATSLAVAKDHIEGVRFAVVIDEAAKRLVEVGGAAANQDPNALGPDGKKKKGFFGKIAGIFKDDKSSNPPPKPPDNDANAPH